MITLPQFPRARIVGTLSQALSSHSSGCQRAQLDNVLAVTWWILHPDFESQTWDCYSPGSTLYLCVSTSHNCDIPHSICINQPQARETPISILRFLGLDIWICLSIAGKKIQAYVGWVKWGHLFFLFLFLCISSGTLETCFRCLHITLSDKSHRGILLFFAQEPYLFLLLWSVYL